MKYFRPQAISQAIPKPISYSIPVFLWTQSESQVRCQFTETAFAERRTLLWFLVVIATAAATGERQRAPSRGREGGAAHYGDGWEG